MTFLLKDPKSVSALKLHDQFYRATMLSARFRPAFFDIIQ